MQCICDVIEELTSPNARNLLSGDKHSAEMGFLETTSVVETEHNTTGGGRGVSKSISLLSSHTWHTFTQKHARAHLPRRADDMALLVLFWVIQNHSAPAGKSVACSSCGHCGEYMRLHAHSPSRVNNALCVLPDAKGIVVVASETENLAQFDLVLHEAIGKACVLIKLIHLLHSRHDTKYSIKPHLYLRSLSLKSSCQSELRSNRFVRHIALLTLLLSVGSVN